MKRLLSVTLMVLVTLVGISAYADALVLCQDSRGAVFVRIKCNSNYDMYQLDPVALGLVGPQGPPGVANGISVAVHGTVEDGGVKVSGEGFTVALALPGVVPDVTITFDPPIFQQPPDCTATSLDPSFYFCMIYALTKEGFNVFCASPDVTAGILQFHTTGGPFSFICVH